MLKLISFISCLSTTSKPIQEPVYLDYPLSYEYGLVTTQVYDAVHRQYAPSILKRCGSEIEALVTQNPDDERSQFIQRYIKAIIYKLSLIPAEKREAGLLLAFQITPESEKEHNYIHNGSNNPPIPIANIGVVSPHRRQEVVKKIQAIKDELSAIR